MRAARVPLRARPCRRSQRAPATRASASEAGLFAAARRAPLTLPAVLLTLRSEQLPDCATALEEALRAGATGVVLRAGAGAGDGALLAAAVQLRGLLRGRALLLLADRPDVAAAAECDGVLLSASGLPTLLARRALPPSRLVLRQLAPGGADAAAAAAEGADALLLPGATPEALRAAAAAAGFVPLLAAADAPPQSLEQLAAAGARGALLAALEAAGSPAEAGAGVASAARALAEAPPPSSAEPPPPPPAPLGAAASELLARERVALGAVLDWLAAAAPGLGEASLLEESLASLGGPFLLVVAGEFNSGKSSVINALLGEALLTEGVLPTTNEVTVLCGGGAGAPRRAAQPDGSFRLETASPLLATLSLVDTPGTNVILERQQRLAEEFVPRADLVLFVLSADRPLSESEARFLAYIAQWEKRVAFALNKADLLADPGQVQAVSAFVADNAARLLGAAVRPGEVFPVSARAALAAKRAAACAPAWGAAPPRLAQQPAWRASGFEQLEGWLAAFLGGGGEALRLKLLTPLQLAAALLEAAGRELAAQQAGAEAEAGAVRAVRQQLDAFAAEMGRDAEVQRRAAAALVAAAARRGEAFVDATLRLQSGALLAALQERRPARAPPPRAAQQAADAGLAAAGAAAAGGTRKLRAPRRAPEALRELAQRDSLASAYLREVVAGGQEELAARLAEHSAWLRRNSERQVAHYAQAVAARGRGGGALAPEQAAGASAAGPPSAAQLLAAGFDQSAAALLLAEELRGAALGSAGGAAGSLALGATLAGSLPGGGDEALALALAASGAYVGLLSLPLRRVELKAKLGRAADALARQIDAALREELEQELRLAREAVEALLAPWDQACVAELRRLEAQRAKGAELEQTLRRLTQAVLAL